MKGIEGIKNRKTTDGKIIKALRMIARIVFPILAIFWMCMIFGFSNQKGNASSSMSQDVSYYIVKTANNVVNNSVTEGELWKQALYIEYPIRKMAHMSEYAIMSLLWFLTLISYNVQVKKSLLIPIVIVFAYACTDEIHQLFVADRSGKFTDVLFDTSGAILMMLLVRFASKFRIKIKTNNYRKR